MNIQSKNKIILFITFIVSSTLILLTESVFQNIHKGIFREYEQTFLEPVFYLSTAIFLSSFILVWFSNAIFSSWYRIFKWFAPVALLLILLSSPGVSYAGISRVAMATMLGSLLVLGTLVYALVLKFVYKK